LSFLTTGFPQFHFSFMPTEYEPALQACPGCAALIDVSEQEPFEQVQCPLCDMTIRVRTQFNNFTLVDVLGSGGMGAVYRALDQTLNRYVALKVVRKEFSKDPTHLAQFEKEAQITASVNHPHVVKVYSYGQDSGSFYIAMELVNKGSLDELMAEQKRVPEAKVLQIGYQIAQGLQAAQNAGLIHRDVKPGNILFADSHTAKIVDFGLATVFEKDAEARGEIWGTPFYVCPERLKNEPEDFRSDIYSLGATLFHAIAGRPPFEATSSSVAALRHTKSHAVSLVTVAPEVSSPTAVVIDRMIKQNPNHRFQSYDELIELLAYAGTNLSSRGVKAPIAIEAKKPKNSAFWPLLFLISLLLLGGFAAYSYFNGDANNDAHVFVGKLRAQWLARESNATPAPKAESSKPEDALLEKYEAARTQFLSGNYPGALVSFSAIQESPSIKPLMLRWVLFHKAFAQLLGDDYHQSEGSFVALAQAGMFSDAPNDRVLAHFFVETGRLGSQTGASKMHVHQKAKLNACDSLESLVLGLKQWRSGKYEEAGVLLSAFAAATPAEACLPYAQVSDYKSLGKKGLEESQAFIKAADKAKTDEAAEKQSPSASAAAPVADPSAEALALLEKNELDAVAKAQQKLMADLSGYRFSSAHKTAEAMALKTKNAMAKKVVLIKLTGWLADFKQGLLADLNREGFPFPIKGVNGSSLEGGIGSATESEINLKTPYGSIPIAWEKVSPDSILTMGGYFLKKEHDPTAFGERKWKLGVYACQFGRSKQGRLVLVELAPSRSEYAESLDAILELSR
jgi:serine/threonine protein kinase